jgi:pimeloyl-ACP methyl ester carboxylesterase
MLKARTGTLEIAYADAGPRDGQPLLLLHGWPYDAASWDVVAALLHDQGIRTITPSLRGFGATRFLDDGAPRTGDAAILAHDAIDLMDALGISTFAVAGHDWGSSTGEAIAVGWPERITRLAMLATPPRVGGMRVGSFTRARELWYQWFMATAVGIDAIRADRTGFGRIMWDTWSPTGWYDEATFARAAQAWQNPDWLDVTVHSYRSRWHEAPYDPRSAALAEHVAATDRLALPTLYIQGAVDGVMTAASTAGIHDTFSGPFERLVLEGVGHAPQMEAPERVAAAITAHLTQTLK